MLLIDKTVMLIVAESPLGFFIRSGNEIPFSVELSDFCRSFGVEKNTTIKIFFSHDVLLTTEKHNVIKINSLFEILTKILHNIILRTQNR